LWSVGAKRRARTAAIIEAANANRAVSGSMVPENKV